MTFENTTNHPNYDGINEVYKRKNVFIYLPKVMHPNAINVNKAVIK